MIFQIRPASSHGTDLLQGSEASVARRGFTLLELLVSVSILTLLIVILMSMVDGASKLWRQSENRVDSYREARGAMNTIASDLSSILPSTNTNLFQWESLSGLSTSIQSSPDYSHIFFVTSQPTSSQEHELEKKGDNSSDLCIVGYYVAYAKASTYSENSTLNLYRYFQSSDVTFNQTIKNYASASVTPAPVSPTTTDELVARNVTDFKVRPYADLIDPATASASPSPTPVLYDFKQGTSRPMPNMVEIELTVVNNETAQRLKTIDDWKNKTSPEYQKNHRTFITRVRLPTDTAVATPTPTPTPPPTPSPTP